MIGVISAGIGLVSSWLTGKQRISEAKVERETKALVSESNWDSVQAEASKGSWKDEWLTLLVSIPLVLAFIPGMDIYVMDGFAVLAKMPEWYQYTIGLVFSASFGVKGAMRLIGNKK